MIRVLLVGFGEMGSVNHLPVITRMGAGIEIVGVVRARTNVPTGLDSPVFGDTAEALKKTRPDLALISTPHALHAQGVRLALEAGCHTLVEKPLALKYSEAIALTRLAERQRKVLLVGLQRRYEGFSAVVRELASSGRLGRIQMAHGLFAHRFDGDGLAGWRSSRSLGGEGILHDSSFHVLDTLLGLTGGSIRALRGASVLRDAKEVPHSCSVVIEMDSGTTISATASYLSPRNSVQEEYSIFGDEGAVFARRFCREHNVLPPTAYWKSADGKHSEEFDLSLRPSGRSLPLLALLDYLQGSKKQEALLTEAHHVLETHRAIDLILNEE